MIASISYDPTHQRLTLVNRSVGLQRRVLLLGASRKADSVHVIGQFGEGMKVGALALLREGRSVEMLTGDERWRWTRRMDDAFGVRVGFGVCVSSGYVELGLKLGACSARGHRDWTVHPHRRCVGVWMCGCVGMWACGSAGLCDASRGLAPQPNPR